MRVVPFENEAVNECWISDRDRFSYEGLNSADRLTAPMVRGKDGQWREVEWTEALDAVIEGLDGVRQSYGVKQIGALSSAYATTEEFALLARLARGIGTQNVDFRLRQTDANFDAARSGTPWLGMPIAELGALDRVLIVGSFLRKDHPLFAQRLRQAAKRGTQILLIDVAGDDPLLPVAARLTVTPSELPRALAEVTVALARAAGTEVPAAYAGVEPGETAQAIAASFAGGKNAAVLLGNLAVNHPQASVIAANAQGIADATDARLGFLTEGGNTVGGYLADAVPHNGGLTAAQMLAQPLKAYIVLHAEPTLDADDGAAAARALAGAEFNVALTPFKSAAQDWAHVMLPVSPFTETSGTYVNAEGRAQSFKGTVRPLGQTRPAWKVLRVLGNGLHLDNFEDETSESVRDSVLSEAVTTRLSNRIQAVAGLGQAASTGLERVTDVPIYFSDAIARRADGLQAAPASAAPKVRVNAQTLQTLGLEAGQTVRVRSAAGSADLALQLDERLPNRAVRISASHASTVALGGAFVELNVERI